MDMLCTKCGKNQARAYVVRTQQGERTIYLCPACHARLYGGEQDVSRPADEARICPSCGTSLAEFKKTGLLGCADCYQVFREELLPTVRLVQGRLTHTGKDPVRALGDEKRELEDELSDAQKSGDRFRQQRIRYRLSVIERLLGGEE